MRRCEDNIRLRRSRTVQIQDAIADAILCYPLFKSANLAGLLSASEYSPEMRYRNISSGSIELELIAFAMEMKRNPIDSASATHQLCFDLSTAQSQRCALGLSDEVIFGGTFVDGKVTIFSSSWTTVSESLSHLHPL